MNTAQPIRSKKELDYFKNYCKTEEINPRNQVLITIGLNTALRISSSGIQNSQKGGKKLPSSGKYKPSFT